MSGRKEVLLVSASEAGHRASYLTLFSTLFPARRARNIGEVLRSANPALFLMIEESFGAYVVTALIRAVLGRRTTGLLFRPGPALRPTTLRLRLKAFVLRLLRRLPQVTTLTILPFSVDPSMSTIADGWIRDPQMWDLTATDRKAVETARGSDNNLSAAIRLQAGSRPIIAAIGRQDQDKGFDRFAALHAENPSLRENFLFAYGGKVAPEVAASAAAFANSGGFAADRILSDADVLEFYAAADLVWCCYAPGYDQASGIFGRAVQLGITAIVREGSLIHLLCLDENLPHLAITDETAVARLLAHTPGANSSTHKQTAHWQEQAIATLRKSLGLAS